MNEMGAMTRVLRWMVGAGLVGGFLWVSAAAASAADPLPGDGRASTPEQRKETGTVPRYGADFENNQIRWSYDWRAPYDTNSLTQGVKIPYPQLQPVVPSDLVIVENDAYHQQASGRTAEGDRKETNPRNEDWNLTTSDIKAPGVGRLWRWDMVCPNAEGRTDSSFDRTYTGATTIDLNERRMVFSYQWGDRLFNDAFIFGHYVPYSLSNDNSGSSGSGSGHH